MLKSRCKGNWTDEIKYITFENSDNKKVSSDSISKTFNSNVSKETLINDFQKNNCNTWIINNICYNKYIEENK